MSGTAACVSLIDTSIFQMEGTFSFTSFAFYHLFFPFEQNFILIESKAAFIRICVYASTKIPVSFYGGELYMTVKDAVAERFQELCRQRVICPNELANLAGGHPFHRLQPAEPSPPAGFHHHHQKTVRWVGYYFGPFFLLSPVRLSGAGAAVKPRSSRNQVRKMQLWNNAVSSAVKSSNRYQSAL